VSSRPLRVSKMLRTVDWLLSWADYVPGYYNPYNYNMDSVNVTLVTAA
jgi:hypothetical protein